MDCELDQANEGKEIGVAASWYLDGIELRGGGSSVTKSLESVRSLELRRNLEGSYCLRFLLIRIWDDFF